MPQSLPSLPAQAGWDTRLTLGSWHHSSQELRAGLHVQETRQAQEVALWSAVLALTLASDPVDGDAGSARRA